MPATLGLSWVSIFRLGLVQTALGAIIIMTTTTLNRVMVVELALPATLPGLLVAIHHCVQMLRPRLGYGSDMGVRRTPWIIGGMGVLALGGIVASGGVALMGMMLVPGVVVAALGFFMVGLGSGAAGTSLLALLASMVEPHRRAPAATILWVMMIAGFAVTATLAGKFLDPFSPARLVAVTASVAAIAFTLAAFAVQGVESSVVMPARAPEGEKPAFSKVLAEVWADPVARRFTVFVFVSMLAYSASDLIIEPFAGEVFGFTIGQSTSLAGMQNGGTLAGMIVMAVFGSGIAGRHFASLRGWMIGGCIASAAALVALAMAPQLTDPPLPVFYVGLGLANGAFAAAAIASMMQLAGAGRSGTRMGLWGAAQAIAFAIGGFSGTVLADLARLATGDAASAYATVFVLEAGMFLVAAILAARLAVTRLPAFRVLPMKEAVS
jgi:MFS transporter, BCD family, chlorophyll transporter